MRPAQGSWGAVVIMAAMCTSGCILLAIPRKMPFVHSSMDFNGGKPHESVMRPGSPETLAQRLEALGAEQGLRVVSKDCRDGACLLVLESKVTELSKTYVYTKQPPAPKRRSSSSASKRYSEVDMATGAIDLLVALNTGAPEQTRTETAILRLQSRYFVRTWAQGEEARVEMVGAPIENGRMSCPALVAARMQKCKAPRFAVYNKKSPADTMRHFWEKADISGRVEADAIERLLEGLDAQRPPASR